MTSVLLGVVMRGSGSVVKKNDRWYVVIEDKDPATGARKRRWLSGFRTKREAQAACNELVVAMQLADYLQANRQTVGRVRAGVVGDDCADGSSGDVGQVRARSTCACCLLYRLPRADKVGRAGVEPAVGGTGPIG